MRRGRGWSTARRHKPACACSRENETFSIGPDRFLEASGVADGVTRWRRPRPVQRQLEGRSSRSCDLAYSMSLRIRSRNEAASDTSSLSCRALLVSSRALSCDLIKCVDGDRIKLRSLAHGLAHEQEHPCKWLYSKRSQKNRYPSLGGSRFESLPLRLSRRNTAQLRGFRSVEEAAARGVSREGGGGPIEEFSCCTCSSSLPA